MSGGGTRSAYGAGALLAMAERFSPLEPDLLIAESGSVLSAMYYLAGQTYRLMSGWLTIPKTPRFISRTRRPFIDIRLLTKTILKEKIPLDEPKLKTARTPFFVPLTRVKDGKVEYHRFSKKDDPYRLLHAAMALPIFYGKSVRIGRNEYIDGGFGAHMNDHINYAARKGATHIIAIQSSNGPATVTRTIYRMAEKEWERNGRKGLAKAALQELRVPAPLTLGAARLVMLTPSRKLPVSVGTKSKRKLRETVNLGYADAANDKKLARLLKHHESARRK
jgi:predicted patatin/cPLA2 family phospholipase